MSAAGDVYSLAATVHSLIAGSPPIAPVPGEEIVSLYLRISRDPPADLRPLGVPDVVCQALEQALAKRPADRPASAAELGWRLQAAQAAVGEPVTPMSVVGEDGRGPGAVQPAVQAPASAPPVVTTPLGGTRVRTAPAAVRRAAAVQVQIRRSWPWLVAVTAAVVLALVAALLLRPDFGGNNGGEPPGSSAQVGRPLGLAVLPDGSVLVADNERHRVLRVAADGEVSTYAGTGTDGNSGDEGPATEATLSSPSGLALGRDGDVYVVSAGLVRRIDPAGTIHPVPGFPTDPGMLRLAVLPDGTVAATDGDRVLTLSPSGELRTLVPEHRLDSVGGLAVHPDGWLAVADFGGRILRVSRSGELERIAGLAGAAADPRTDGLPARESVVSEPSGLAFDSEGRLHFSETGNGRVRMVTDEGVLRTVAGNPEGYGAGDSGDGGPGRDARFALLAGPLAFAANGDLYIGDEGNGRVRRLDADGRVHAFLE